MTSQRGSRVRIPPSPLKAEAELFSLGFSRRRRDHPFSFFLSAESYSSVAPLRRWWSQVLPPSALCTGTRPSFSMSQSAQEDPRHLLSPPMRRETPSKRVPTRAGGPRTTLHSSYASGNPLQACSDSHRRTAGALALLLCRPYLSVDPSPRVLDPFRGCREPP